MLTYDIHSTMSGETMRSTLRRIDTALKLGHHVTMAFTRDVGVTFVLSDERGPLRVCPLQYKKDPIFARQSLASRDPRFTHCGCRLGDSDDDHPTKVLED